MFNRQEQEKLIQVKMNKGVKFWKFSFLIVWAALFVPSQAHLGLLAAASVGSVSLAWDASTQPGLTGYKIYYGTASRTYGPPVTIGNQTQYTVTGLVPGTYYFTLTAYDTSGQESSFSNEVSTAIKDVAPAVISGVTSAAVTASTATIAWTTDEGSDSQVDYGGTTAYGNSTPLLSSLVTSHSQALAGLTPGSLYHYRVKSRDAAGNLAVSGDFTFTTTAGSSCDINGDGVLNVLDLQVLANTILGTQSCPGNCDIDRDGKIDVVDLQVFGNILLGVRSCQ